MTMGFRFYIVDRAGNVTDQSEWDDDITGVYAASYYGKIIIRKEIAQLYDKFKRESERTGDLQDWLQFMETTLEQGASWVCF